MSAIISMVPLSATATLNMAEIQRKLRTNWPDLPSPTNVEQDDTTLAFRLGEADVIIALMPVPIPWTDLEALCATSILWPDAAIAVKPHKSHAIVTVMGELPPISLAKTLTLATASVMATLPEALGVCWFHAAHLIRKDLFIEFACNVLPKEAPLHVWVNIRVEADSRKTCMGFTTDMESLGHKEFEVQNAPVTPNQLYDRLFSLAGYVLENGAVLNNGHTVGENAQDLNIRVVYADSIFGHEGRVIRLEYSQPPSPLDRLRRLFH